ncbi:MAG: hypothetical protein AABX37_02155, partial [Nanoarchaeota archaeon]
MKKTILVADDYRNEREKIRELLELEYNVILAADGMIALDKLEEMGIDGIDGAVLDYMMMHDDDTRLWEREIQASEFYGDAVARKFRQAGFTGPIVIRSTMADSLTRRVDGLNVYL